MMHRAALLVCFTPCFLIFTGSVHAAGSFLDDVFRGGHAKYIESLSGYPVNSLFRDAVDNPSRDSSGDLRLKFSTSTDALTLSTDYQLAATRGDRFQINQLLPGNIYSTQAIPDDDNRLMDLTHNLSEGDDYAVTHRLDRLHVDYIKDNTVLRIGRQAVSWGNGLIYTPMDFFNPFDPAAIDKEYKTGDDMLYAQQLLQSGDDIQAVWVVRRDDTGDVSSDVDSVAIKYHGFAPGQQGEREYDLLLAAHYRDLIIGIGGLTSIGSAIVRGDITYTNSETSGDIYSLVASHSYSWTFAEYNMSSVVEYFYNGFGQSGGNYQPAALAANTALIDRVTRGELFTLGRHYLATSLLIEMTPLWTLTPNAFINVSDTSMLLQLLSQHSLLQELQFLFAVSIPVGPDGTEFGGIDSGIDGKPLSTDFNLYAQLAWYF
jgi:hypothetical protein